MDTRNRILEQINTWLLVVIGIFGVLISLADLFADLSQFGNKLEVITLLMLSLLSASIGIERMTWFRRQDRRIQEIERSMTKILGGQYIRSTDEIYNSAIRLCDSVDNRFRAFIFATISGPVHPRLPRELAKAIAQRLKESEAAGNPAKFEVVVVSDFENQPPDFLAAAEARDKLYEEQGVIHLLSRHFLNMRPLIGFDVLIFDRKHTLITFPKLHGVQSSQSAILYENQPGISSDFADWFDQIAIRDSIGYEEWRSIFKNAA
jgi:hypothetical protein